MIIPCNIVIKGIQDRVDTILEGLDVPLHDLVTADVVYSQQQYTDMEISLHGPGHTINLLPVSINMDGVGHATMITETLSNRNKGWSCFLCACRFVCGSRSCCDNHGKVLDGWPGMACIILLYLTTNLFGKHVTLNGT